MAEKKYGSREEVYNGMALMTSSKLTREDLTKNKAGKVVSKRLQQQARKNNPLGDYLASKSV